MSRRSISFATNTISSSDGVMRPLRPMRSAFSSSAVCENLVARHHHAEIDDLVAVAAEHDADDVLADVVDVALDRREDDLALATRVSAAPPAAMRASRSASMNGSRYATARFIARALLTTCGRNILPAPNRSPTTFMPSISGPSMMSSGRGYFCRASSTSASMKSTTPCTSACDRRASTVAVAPARGRARASCRRP